MILKVKDYLFVGVQFLLFLLYLPYFEILDFSISPSFSIMALILTIIGFAIIILAILQLNKNLSPFPSPKTNSELVKNGLYKFIRHPIYTGILLGFFGFAVFSESLFRIIITLLLYILFLFKTKYEEEQLLKRYDDYAAYLKKTGRFFPVLFQKDKK